MNKITLLILLVLSFSAFGLGISAPFDQGVASNDMRWEVRFNFPACDHEGRKSNVWCTYKDDSKTAIKISGVEAKLKSWINDEKVKALYLAYMSFSNRGVKKALCDGAKKRKDLILKIFVNYSSYESTEKFFNRCNRNKNVEVFSRGKGPFTEKGSHLQHSKIFLALETGELKNITDYSSNELKEEKGRRIRFTSSSANMSGFGTNLHFENWLFFNAKADDYVAQQNVCVFKAFGNEKVVSDSTYRDKFKVRYADCVEKIYKSKRTKKRKDMTFYLVPAVDNKLARRPFQDLKKAALSAKDEVLVAIHRLGSSALTGQVFKKLAYKRGVKFKIIFDDDTLRVGKKDGGPSMSTDSYDVRNYRMLRDTKRAEIYFMETNARAIKVGMDDSSYKAQMFHNKFIVVDDKFLFQGAGNFTGSALNYKKDKNFEQFYLIKNRDIVKAYKEAWYKMRDLATYEKDHEDYDKEDLPLNQIKRK